MLLEHTAVVGNPVQAQEWLTSGNTGPECTHVLCFFKYLYRNIYGVLIGKNRVSSLALP
jgi:hypothetical protein